MNKKVLSVITASAMAVTFCFTACRKVEEHAYSWSVQTPATCVSTGTEQGVCVDCGDVIYREIPVNPDNHSYGEWDVTLPTAEAEGSAVKTCAYEASHVINVTLPMLTDEGTGYASSEITVPPTALKDGVRTFVYSHTAGDIIFTIPVSARGIQTVADAVEVGTAYKNLIASAYGIYTSNENDLEKHPYTETFYEVGDNYTHIIDNINQREMWYSLTAMNMPFALIRTDRVYGFENKLPTQPVQAGSALRQDPSPTADYMKGATFTTSYLSGSSRYYGTEDFLKGIFDRALACSNGDYFEEIIKRPDGGVVCKFGFGDYSPPSYFSKVEAEFALGTSLAVESFKVKIASYENTYENKWERDEETGFINLVEGATPGGVESYEITQTLAPENYQKPQNPYPEQSLKVKSFDLARGSTIIGDQAVNIAADVVVSFAITNVENYGEGINNIDYDPVSCYLRTSAGDEEVNFGTLNSKKFLAYQSGKNVTVRSNLKGPVTLVVKTQSGSFEKVVNLNVTPKTPSRIMPGVREYGGAGYYWTTKASGDTIVAYTGQPLQFCGVVPAEEESYCDTRIIASTTEGATVTNLADTEIWEFNASVSGNYRIAIRSYRSASITCVLNVNVINYPTANELFNNTAYRGLLQYPYPNTEVTLSCRVTAPNQGIIAVETLEGREVLSFTMSGTTVTTSHMDGAELGFSVYLNETYSLVLTHFTEFEEEESIILTRVDTAE